MLTKKRVKLVNYKEFAAVALNLKEEALVVHMVLLEIQDIVHLFCRAHNALFIIDEAPIKVSKKYAEYVNIFSKEAAMELPEYIGINNYLIDLKECK